MTQKKLFLILLISFIGHGFAQETCEPISSTVVSNALRLSSFVCETKTVGRCVYDECLGKISGYSKPVLVLLPQSMTSMRIHFHGHKLNVFPAYDKNLKSMVKAFGLEDDICKGTEAVIFPESSGKCADYDLELKDAANFKRFFAGINSATGNHLKEMPVHVSAHSGGGRTVGRMLEAGVKVDEVSIFDGIYSEALKNQIKTWYKREDGQLNLHSIKGQSPANYVAMMVKELDLKLTETNPTIQQIPYKKSVGSRIRVLNRESGSDTAIKAHYDIVSQTWGQN